MEAIGVTTKGTPRQRRPKAFSHDELTLLILHLLRLKPSHGYGLIKALKQFSQGCYQPSPGVIYPILATLSEQDMVEQRSVLQGKKLFTITSSGEAYLEEQYVAVRDVLGKLRQLMLKSSSTYHSRIELAFDRLKMSVQKQLNQSSSLSVEQAEQIALIIEKTAKEIESL